MLSGKFALRDDPYVVIDVSGVGYKVYVGQDVLMRLPSKNEALMLFTYTHVREDALELYGFTSPEDLKLFEHLISVSGIGCKTAMGIFSVGKRVDVINAILDGDTAFFTAVPRLGKKNAQKLIIELKGKFGSTKDLDLHAADGSDEVVAALESFGFTSREAYQAVKALNGKGDTVQERIRLALKQLGK